MEQLEKTALFILEKGLLPQKECIGAAVSGGADSMAMLDMLLQLGYKPTVLHFEHGIRGEESRADMRFVRERCGSLGVPFVWDGADVPNMRERGESVETAARRLRYAFFEREAARLGLYAIATAHHADDNAETFIMNLLRGGGMTGLTGISARRGIYVRPMLALSRAEIEDYVHKRGIPFVTDSTNLSEDYTRNRIRSRILPVFAEINPSYASAIARACSLLTEDDDALSFAAEEELLSISHPEKGGLSIDIKRLLSLKKGLAMRILREAISRVCPLKDIERTHFEAVYALALSARTGRLFALEDKFAAFVSYNRLIIADKLYKIERSGFFVLNVPGVTRIWEGELIADIVPEAGETTAEGLIQYLDADKLEGAEVRARRSGDIIYPLGAGGKKKLKDWLIDKKVPVFLRDGLPLIAREGEVLWAVGAGISESVRVDGGTKSTLRVEYRP